MTALTPGTSPLKRLRALTPLRAVTFAEALRVAELQATTLSHHLAASSIAGDHELAGMPRITVIFERLSVSGMSHWDGKTWIIAISTRDSRARQRFTLMHEFKHIIDHGSAARLYTGDRARTRDQQAELAADYFAGCTLVPKRDLKRAWGNGLQKTTDLARAFDVSEQAIRVRLAQTGLDTERDHEPTARCARPVRTRPGRRQTFRPITPSRSRRSYA